MQHVLGGKEQERSSGVFASERFESADGTNPEEVIYQLVCLAPKLCFDAASLLLLVYFRVLMGSFDFGYHQDGVP
jgi:hypothetical protein